MGTWENGVFDYDHLKGSYLPTFTRYWDDNSKVPFLFNPSIGIWITYDDLESISLKNDYIKREQLGGAMFWELSSDRNVELVGATFVALTNGQTLPPPVTNQSFAATSSTAQTIPSGSTVRTTPPGSTASATTNQAPSGNALPWQTNIQYNVGDHVTYDNKTYRCIQAHRSLPGWAPAVVPALWHRCLNCFIFLSFFRI